MKQKNKRALFSFVIAAWLLAAAVPSQGEPWALHDGSLLIKVGLSRIDTQQQFDGQAIRKPYLIEFPALRDGEYSTTDISLFAAYGVTEDFAIIGATQLRQSTLSYVDTGAGLIQRPNSGLGDIYLGGRLQIFDSPVQIFLQAGMKIPSADTGDASGVALGDGQMDFDGLLLVAYQLNIAQWKIFARSRYGMLFRGGTYDNAIIYMADLGADLPGGKVGLHAGVDGMIMQGTSNGPDGVYVTPGLNLTNNMTRTRATIGALYHPTQKMEFYVDWTTVLNGRATLAGNTISLGIVLMPLNVAAPVAKP